MATVSACKRIFTVRNERGVSPGVHFAWQKSPGGLLASSAEGSPFVLIHERQGKLVEKLSIPASCVGLSWDEDGDILAIIVEHPGVLLLWEVHSSKLQEIDTGMKDIGSCVGWSTIGKILCFASQKGNILIYNHRNLRRIPIIGKHSKRIVCVQWSNDTLLALGTTDNFLSVNTQDGDTVKNFQLRGKPSDLQFGHIKEDRNQSPVDNTVSAIVGEKTLYLLKFDDGQTQGNLAPMELGFQSRYGNLVTHHWHGDGYILVSFSAGFIVLLSSHYKEIGTELVLCELKADPLRHACLNSKLSRLAVCFGDSMIQIHDAVDPKSIVNMTDISDEDGRVRPAVKCSWTLDGQLLAVVNTSGDIGVFLTSVPMLGGYNWNQIAAMSSLTDVVLYSMNDGQLVPEFTFNLDFEPSFIVLGPYLLAACLNNKVWFFPSQEFHSPPSNQAVACKEFNSNIQELVVNADYCAARCGDKAYLTQIEGDGMDLRGMRTFPEQNARAFKITCLCMSKDVFVYGGENGILRIFHLDSWCEIIQVQSPAGVTLKTIHPNFNGIYFVVIDKHSQGFFYNIDEDVMKPVPNFPSRVDGVLWDTEFGSRHIFLAYSLTSTKIQVYMTWRQVLIGDPLHQVGTFQWFQTSEHRPLCFRNGVIVSMTASGKVIRTQCVYLDKPEVAEGSLDLPDGKMTKLNRLLVMKKFEDAYDYCLVSKDEDMYLALGKACLESMELEIAMKAYVAVNDIGMVYSIKRAMKNQDYSQCCGNVAVILGEFDLAEQKYLEAGLRIPALQMRRDLQEWDKALEMAQKFAPHLVADVSREYALYHEHNGEYAVALTLFEEAFNKFGDSKRAPPRPTTSGGRALSSQLADGRVLKQIEEGIARNSIRCGHIQKGFQMALDSNSSQHKRDCANILESSKSYAEAGALYEDCKLWENAASCYIRMKNWSRVADLLQYIQSPKIFVQFGKAKETEGKLREAAVSYEKANDVMNSIRLYLSADYPDDAIRVARTSGSLSGAMLVSRYFEEHGDMETALRFLIISRCYEDALLVAFKHGKSETYVQCIQDEFPDGAPTEFLDGIRQVAAYFEEKKDNFKAGKYYQVCEDYKKSFTLLMKAAQNRVTVDDNELMEVIIQTVIKSDNEGYARTLVEFLLGEKDGVPKDPKFLLSYYISANKLVEASKTALIVAMEDQKGGNYRDAHSTLVRTCKELKAHSMKIPKDIMDALKILHYYLLVRKHVNVQNHKQAARLLIVLVDNISKFSTHAVQLLTTAVVECQKAGLRQSSMQCCFTLMKPDYRKQIPEKFKPKIETMVRKSGKAKLEDVPDDLSPCPYCQAMLPDYTLVCTDCKSEIPFCIASGRHIFSGDFTTCPKCEFPAIRSEILRLLENEPFCPLCGENLAISDVNLINDLHPYLFVTRTG